MHLFADDILSGFIQQVFDLFDSRCQMINCNNSSKWNTKFLGVAFLLLFALFVRIQHK